MTDRTRETIQDSSVKYNPLVVETIARICRDHLVKGIPIKKLARDLRVSKNTIRKVVGGDATAHTYERKIQPMPKLGLWVGEFERRLEDNEKKRRRDRLSVPQIYEDLAALGYEGGYDAMRRYARAWRWRHRLLSPSGAYVPLSFDTGEACQIDWSHDAGEGGAHGAVAQPNVPGPGLPALGPGDGVRGARAGFSLLRRGIHDNMKTAVSAVFTAAE